MINQASISNTAQPISQGWPNGECKAVGEDIDALVWRVPISDTSHEVLRIVVDADGQGVGAGIRLKSEGGNQTKEVFFNGRETKLIDLQVLQGAAGFGVKSDYDEISLELLGSGGSIELFDIDSSYSPPPSVVNFTHYTAGGDAFEFLKVGTNVLEDESSISSLVGHITTKNIEALRMRRRSLGCWSAFNPGGNSSSTSWWGTSAGTRIAMIQPGTVSAGKGITLHVRTVNPTNDVQAFSVFLREPGGARLSEVKIEIPAQQAESWSVHSLNVFESGRIPNPRRPLTPEPFVWMGVDTLEMTTRGLISLSAWCE